MNDTAKRELADQLRTLADKVQNWQDGTPTGAVTNCVLELWNESTRTHITVLIEPIRYS